MCIYHIFFIHSSTYGHLCCLNILAIVNKVTINIEVHISFWSSVFICFRKIPRSGIVGSYCRSVFNFLSILLHTVSHSGCTNLHSHQEHTKVCFISLPCQYLFFVVFLVVAILIVVKWYFIVALICIPLEINDVEHLFVYLLAINMYSLEKCLLRSSAHVFIGLFVFLMVNFLSSLYILDINCLMNISFANIFYSVGGFFILLIILHCKKSFLKLVQYHLLLFLFLLSERTHKNYC